MNYQGAFICGVSAQHTGKLVGWNKRLVSYAIRGELPGITRENMAAATRNAFLAWQNVCGLTFKGADQDHIVDILVETGRIDGPNRTLAHSQMPNGLDHPLRQKYDISEPWGILVPQPRQIYLPYVLEHEIGHAIGLYHMPGRNRMKASYDGEIEELQPAEIAAVQALYGPPIAKDEPVDPIPSDLVTIKVPAQFAAILQGIQFPN